MKPLIGDRAGTSGIHRCCKATSSQRCDARPNFGKRATHSGYILHSGTLLVVLVLLSCKPCCCCISGYSIYEDKNTHFACLTSNSTVQGPSWRAFWLPLNARWACKGLSTAEQMHTPQHLCHTTWKPTTKRLFHWHGYCLNASSQFPGAGASKMMCCCVELQSSKHVAGNMLLATWYRCKQKSAQLQSLC